ncbi:MAG: DUF952 domain-containing protein [Anaerolineae bacterium]|nr:DUF952 domain-containing protein [Anaerolineae bacterium]
MIYHITSRSRWDAAQTEGFYQSASLESEGFIHFSTWEQVLRVANQFYVGQTDLVLLEVIEEQLTQPLKYESPNMQGETDAPKNELFPHLYGRLNLNAVINVYPLTANTIGQFQLPQRDA